MTDNSRGHEIILRIGRVLLGAIYFLGGFSRPPLPDNVFVKEISMIGGLLILFGVGPGSISLDRKRSSA